MNYQLIMLPNPILVGDEEIKNGDWKYCSQSDTILKADLTKENKSLTSCCFYCKKIIAGLPELPRLDLSLVDVGYVDVEKLAWISCENSFSTALAAGWWVEGFKACQSLNQKKYTEEDMIRAIEMAQEESWDEGGYLGLEHTPDEILKLLQQPKVYNVNVQIEENIIKVTNII